MCKLKVDVVYGSQNCFAAGHICERNVDIAELLIDNFKDEIKINVQDDEGRTAMFYFRELLIDNFKDSIDIMILDENDRPSWYAYLYHYQAEDDFKDLFYRCY